MAFTRYAIASGNWSNTAIWDSGAIPSTDDIVFPNTFTVALDQDVNVLSLKTGTPTVYLPNMAIPIMTSNTAPTGVASAGTVNATNFAYLAFDQDAIGSGTYWQSAASGLGTTMWLRYDFPVAKIIKRYYIFRPTSTTNCPSGWQFQGSNDGITWATLDTVTGNATTGAYTSALLANTTAYLYYRILITALQAGTSTQLLNFEMTESTSTSYSSTSGGGFTVATNRTVTVTDTLGVYSRATTCITVTASNITLTVNGNVYGGNSANAIGIDTSAGLTNLTLNINGNITGGGTTSSRGILNRANSSTINLTGDSTATSSGTGLESISGSTLVNINITGNISSQSGNYGVYHYGTGTVTMIGNVLGSSSTGSAIALSGGANINITGDINGGGGSGAGVYVLTVANTVTSVGNITAGAGSNGIFTSIAAVINSTGILTASNGAHAIGKTEGGLTGVVTVSGPIINTNNATAIYARNIRIKSTAITSWLFKDETLADKYLYTAGTSLGNPLPADVRNGTTYASGALTGTLKVPPTGSVAVGVPVDATVGTAIISITDMGALLASYNV